MSGLELLSNILEDIEKAVRKNTIEFDEQILKEIEVMKTSFASVTNTSNFMWMTINRCIDYTKASHGIKLIPRNETTHIKKSLETPIKCVADIQSIIKIELKDIPNNISENIITDKQWLQENILCLVSNAVKYSTDGVVTIQMQKVTENKTDSTSKINELTDFLKIEVEDNGIGLSETAMQSLFEPFKQAQRMAGGTGLGLYSLKKRIDALGGTFGASKRKDGLAGSLFWFTIPYIPDTSVNESKISQNVNLSNELSNKSRKVLVVDDSPSILKLLSQTLNRQGFNVDTAENGAIGLEKMIHKSYDIVLMDLQMPVMDGLESVRRLREHEKQQDANIPQIIIGLSANSDNETISEAFNAGITDFLPKPFKMESFFQLLTKFKN